MHEYIYTNKSEKTGDWRNGEEAEGRAEIYLPYLPHVLSRISTRICCHGEKDGAYVSIYTRQRAHSQFTAR